MMVGAKIVCDGMLMSRDFPFSLANGKMDLWRECFFFLFIYFCFHEEFFEENWLDSEIEEFFLVQMSGKFRGGW